MNDIENKIEKEALEFLEITRNRGFVLGLSNMENILKLFSNPDKDLKFIHIAGTNGKGSTATFISNVLIKSNYKVGLYTSPSIFDLTDRIKINNKNIKPETFYKLILEIKEKSEENGIKITEFEVLTAAAIIYFYRENVDIVVLEVGMGGRLDATNVIKEPLLSIITPISMDHTNFLGDNLSMIASEKAGIIKENRKVLVGFQKDEALSVLIKKAKEKNAPIFVVDDSSLEKELKDIKIDKINSFKYKDKEYKTKLIGKYQIKNAYLTIKALELLEDDIKIDKCAIRDGLYDAFIEGRFSILREEPMVIVDGAHNEDGVDALKSNLLNLFEDKKIKFIMGSLKDKDYRQGIEKISGLAKEFYFVPTEGDRGLDPRELEIIGKKYVLSRSFSSVEEAVKASLSESDKEDIIVVFGSLSILKDAINSVRKSD